MMNTNLSFEPDTQDRPYVDFSYANTGGRVPPHSVDAEQSVLGAVLIDNEALINVLEFLRAEDFYQNSHRTLFEAMVSLYERQEAIDVVTLTAQLRAIGQLDACGGVEYLSSILDAVPTAANTLYYGRIIKEMSLRRKIIHEANEIATEAFNGRGDIDSFVDEVEKRIFSVTESKVHGGFAKVSEIVKDSIKQVEQQYVSKALITGVPTGFVDIDKITSGFQAGDLVVVAGRPGMGKTSFALSIGRYVGLDLGQQKPVAVFSLEMSKEQIVQRLLCSEARVSNSKIRSGQLGESDFPRIVDAASRIAQSEMYIDDTPAISVLELRAKARRLHRERPLSLIIVDYLQLMRASSKRVERREQEISEISGSLKALAKELKIPVIALSQLNRGVEGRQDKRPMMSDLRESGAIEQDADIIGFVYRDEVYNPDTPDQGISEFIIAKHRNGATGVVRLGFQKEITSFVNLSTDQTYDCMGADMSLEDDDDFLG